MGVRTTGPFADVDLDEAGNVLTNRKGMSVSEDWRTLPGHLIPEHLDDGLNGASGKNMAVFVHGVAGSGFVEGLIAPGLELCFKAGRTSSGNVCPVNCVPIADYQNDLASTRPDWIIDES